MTPAASRPGFLRRRATEAGLLVLTIAFYWVGWTALRLTGEATPAPGLVDAAFPLALLVGHLALRVVAPEADQRLFPIAAQLSGFGVLIVRRLEPDLTRTQTTWMALGIVAMLVVAAYPHLRRLRLYKYTLALAGLGLLIVTAVLGEEAGGARLWLRLGPIAFQPTELLKLVLVLFMAGYLEERREVLAEAGRRVGPFRLLPIAYLAPLGLMWGFSLLLLVWQRDMGATLLLLGTAVIVLYLATRRLAYVTAGLGLFALNVALGLQVFGYIQTRMRAWLSPWADPQDEGYQIIQALVAFANGGLGGAGLGRGQPTLIPAVHTDFVFAAIGEELGLLVALPLLALYLVYSLHGLALAGRMRDDFSTLLIAGLSVLVALQTAIITAGNLQILPLTGITLPFVSYGGSSVVANYLALGLILRLTADAAARRRLPAPRSPLPT